jgi:hypothetical protein
LLLPIWGGREGHTNKKSPRLRRLFDVYQTELFSDNFKINFNFYITVKLDDSLVCADFLNLVFRKGDILAVNIKSFFP